MTKKPHHPLPVDDRAEIDRVPESREDSDSNEAETARSDLNKRTYRYPDGEPYKA